MFLSPSELQHPNLVCLIGVTLDKPPICLITEYMAKVSKHYILEHKCRPHPISIFRGSSNIPYKSKVLNHSVLTNFILSQYFKYRCIKCEVFDLFMSCSSIRNYIIRQKTVSTCTLQIHVLLTIIHPLIWPLQGSLLEYLRSKRRAEISKLTMLDFARDVCSGMAYIETLNFVHR